MRTISFSLDTDITSYSLLKLLFKIRRVVWVNLIQKTIPGNGREFGWHQCERWLHQSPSSTESSREDPGELAELAGVHDPLCRFELEDTFSTFDTPLMKIMNYKRTG